MVSALFLTYAAVAVLVTVNALRAPSPPTSRFPALWLPAMVTSELAPLWLGLRVVVSGTFVALGALEHGLGWTALALVAASEAGLGILILRSRRVARSAVDHDSPIATGWERLSGRATRLPEGVERLDGIEYHHGFTLDLYRGRHDRHRAPALIYVHGGSWTGGDPHRQGRVLFHHLAGRGWVVATIRYPLSPAATFPEHLVGVKRAIAWARTAGARDHGIDPERIALAGGSAGAHLAALAALTPNRAPYQPGFEEVDTSVAACVPMYGVYDFLNRNHTRWDWPVIPTHVMKVERAAAEEAYRQASPLDQVNPSAPPFLVVHGSHDSLVPPPEAHHFVAALEGASSSPVEYLEVEGGQHAFDAVSSPRTRAVTGRITHFLEHVVTRAPERRRDERAPLAWGAPTGLSTPCPNRPGYVHADMTASSADAAVKPRSRLLRGIYFALGLVCLGFAYLSFLPGIPTFDFVILAAFFFARSSDRFHAWLVGHRFFGKVIQGYRGGLTRRVKITATAGILGSLAVSAFLLTDSTLLRAILGLVGVYAVWFVWSRPLKGPPTVDSQGTAEL